MSDELIEQERLIKAGNELARRLQNSPGISPFHYVALTKWHETVEAAEGAVLASSEAQAQGDGQRPKLHEGSVEAAAKLKWMREHSHAPTLVSAADLEQMWLDWRGLQIDAYLALLNETREEIAAYLAAAVPSPAEVEAALYREALEDVAGDYGCGLLEPPDPSLPPNEREPCREEFADDPSRWCVSCVASAALAEARTATQEES